MKYQEGPIVIGGLGGSGTRIVTRLLEELNFFMGMPQNDARDHLFFKLIFNRPCWFHENVQNENEELFQDACHVFETLTLHGVPKNEGPNALFLQKSRDVMTLCSYHKENGTSAAPSTTDVRNLLKLIESEGEDLLDPPDLSNAKGWGWKEPNTHIYLPYLEQYFNNLRYILVLRNGLDMAFLKDGNRLQRWGSFFSLDLEDDQSRTKLPRKRLDYWISANDRVIQIANQLMPDRFHIVYYEELCRNPRSEISKLLRFLNLYGEHSKIESLAKIPEKRGNIARFRDQDLSQFTDDQLRAVNDLGYKISVREKAM